MSALIEQIDHHKFTDTDRLFFDTNIWVYVFGPNKAKNPSQSQESYSLQSQDSYSSGVIRAIKAGSRLFTDVVVLSEFINVCMRTEWENVKSGKNLKKFRMSKRFNQIAERIIPNAKKITNCCELIDSGFSILNTDDIFASYAEGKLDFNDLIISELCRTKGLTLVTDDGDFKDYRGKLLTANKKLLRSSKLITR